MKTTSSKFAAERGIAEEEALKKGMEAKSKKFVEKGATSARRRKRVHPPVAGSMEQGSGIGIYPGDLFHGRPAVGIFLQAGHDDDGDGAEHVMS